MQLSNNGFQTVQKRSLSSLLRLLAVLITVIGNSAPHPALRLERQTFSISLNLLVFCTLSTN